MFRHVRAGALIVAAVSTPVAAAMAATPIIPAPAPPAHGGTTAGVEAAHAAARATAHRRHVSRYRRAARKVGVRVAPDVHAWSDRRLRRSLRRVRRMAVPAALMRRLEAIAACESHGNPRAIGGGGAYRGKYQFDRGTWSRVGGRGDPAAASEAEQDRRAARLLKRSGASPWPVCG
jgi:hypothetical protein